LGIEAFLSRHGLATATGAIALAAWTGLALGLGGLTASPICSLSPWAGPTSLRLALTINPPASLAAGWALMALAMMTPLTASPLAHLRQRSFARRRASATLLFGLGYGLVWLAAGACLEALALGAWIAAPRSPAPLAAAVLIAMAWQVSPAKQICLNGCHHRPALAAFGGAAARDAFVFGLTQGAWCVGGCWALMLAPLMLREGHLAAMAAVAGFLFLERMAPPATPAWRWRPGGC
jgi:predicted metal-binding membrane protein